MTAEELFELLAERRFKPLRCMCPMGESVTSDIPRFVAEDAIAIGVPRDEGSQRAYKITHCAIQNIAEVEPLDSGKRSGKRTSF